MVGVGRCYRGRESRAFQFSFNIFNMLLLLLLLCSDYYWIILLGMMEECVFQTGESLGELQFVPDSNMNDYDPWNVQIG